MTEEVTDLSGEKVPAWLKTQISKAKASAPVAMPAAQLPLDVVDETEKEVYKGPEPKAKKASKKKSRSSFEGIALELSSMLEDKNRKYGDSYAKMAHVLPLFFPNGVPADKLLDAIFILRIVDKLMRIASNQPDEDEDPIKDVAGYAILRMRELRND